MNEPICSEPDCTQEVKARGLCSKHYQRAFRSGMLSSLPPARNRWDRTTTEERFWSKVDKNGPVPAHRPELGPCWMWTGSKMGSGYGLFSLKNKWLSAHRFSYGLAGKIIPDDLELDHLCHPGDGSCPRATCPHRLCVNPDHLEPVTRFMNMKRGNTFTARNLAVTHCPQGHEYTPENTRIRIAPSGNEMRSCKECRRYVSTGKINPLIAANAAKTHCPQGHEYTPENTIIDYSAGGKKGARRCRTCRRDQRKNKLPVQYGFYSQYSGAS